MARWWTLAGMCMVVWALAAPAQAQGPVVFAQDPAPPSCPQFLPQGPGDCPPFNAFQSVPKIRNAWDETCKDNGYLPVKTFGGIGMITWKRQSLGNGVIAVAEPDLPAVGPNADTGALPLVYAPALRNNSVTIPYQLGVDFNVGCFWEDHGVELAGFYQPRAGGSAQATMPGQLSVPFYAFVAQPFGFQGNNGLFLQDDIVEAQLTTQLSSFELNHRYAFGIHCQTILGVRYFDAREKFSIRVDDDTLAAGARGFRADPARQATYAIESVNRIAGPQIGFEIDAPVAQYLGIGFFTKYMVGWDFTDVNQSLTRGDGFTGPGSGRTETLISQVVELGGNASLALNANIRLKLGYNALWVLGVPVAHQQVNFNLVGGTTRNNHGSIFFHGPTVRLEFNF